MRKNLIALLASLLLVAGLGTACGPRIPGPPNPTPVPEQP